MVEQKNPVIDVVMDVASAADPTRYQASIERLRAAQKALKGPVGADSFENLLQKNSGLELSYKLPVALNHRYNLPKAPIPEAYRKFEAFMMQSFIQDMFTSKDEEVFGKGVAGQIWKSMLAEAMGKEIAKGGGLGIAQMIADRQALAVQGPLDGPRTEEAIEAAEVQSPADSDPQLVVDRLVHTTQLSALHKLHSKKV